MAPLDVAVVGKLAWYAIFFAIGLGFGAVLEMSGFGDSRRLVAQFYLKEMRVLKVMFTAIVIAAILLCMSVLLGFLDFNKVWVNHTYLYSQIVGGLIMGVGFIVGGFCPGTSVVASSTLKLDGVMFALGVAFGIFCFGETVHMFQDFWVSGSMGRFGLPEWLGLPRGVTLLLVVLLALAMFYGGEICERLFGDKIAWRDLKLMPSKGKLIGAATLVLMSLIVISLCPTSGEERWETIASRESKKIESREVFIHPGELASLMHEPSIHLVIIDTRSEKDYNLFHLRHAKNVSPEQLGKPEQIQQLRSYPANTVFVMVANDEAPAVHAWQNAVAWGMINCYVLSGGINKWLDTFHPEPEIACSKAAPKKGEQLHYAFTRSVGDTLDISFPGEDNEVYEHLKYEKKVKLKAKRAHTGGCG